MATIQGVYVALFGRPADPTGLTYFNSVTKNGADLNGIGDLASTQEYKDRFAGQNNTQVVNSIYQSLFGRDAEAAGLTFFVNALNTGTLNIKNIAIAILDGAQGSDKTTVTNKVAAADLYTKSLDTAQEIGSYQGNAAAAQGRAFLAGVTSTVPTQAAVDAAILSMQAAGAVGNTITLSVGDAVLSTTTNTFADKVSTNNNDTINAGTTWTAADKIDAGLGIDTFNATLSAGVTVAADGLKNVEIVNITTVTNPVAVDVANAKELTTITHTAAAGSTDLTVNNLSQSATFGLKGALATADTVAFADSDAASSVKVSLDGATATSLTVNNIGTLNIANTGTSSVPLITDAKSIVITGDGSVTFATITDAVLQSVDASASTGAVSVDLSGNDALKSYKGASGIDTVTVDVLHTNDLTISTGAGADTITVLGDRSTTAVLVTENASNKAIVLTGGDGADTFVFGAASANPLAGVVAANLHTGSVGNVASVATVADLVKSLITVSDFAKASDTIKVGDGAAAAATAVTLTSGDLGTIAAQADLLAAATKAATFIGVDKVGIFNYGSDAYILVNSLNTGFEVGDTLIKVTGAVNTDFTATNFAVI